MLEALWDFLVDLASRIADAVKKALSFLADMIMSAIKALLNPLLERMEQALHSLRDETVHGIYTYSSSIACQESDNKSYQEFVEVL